MNHDDYDDYPEANQPSPTPSLQWCAGMVARATLIPVLVIIAALILFAVSGCSQVSDRYDEFRETTEVGLVGGWRDSTLWGGIRFSKVGKAAEIETVTSTK